MDTSNTVRNGTSRAEPSRTGSRLFNGLVLLVAGTRLFPLYGVIMHRGRRSGRLYRTPVVVRPMTGGFVVPMPWGESTDWFRNVKAAGECIIRWKAHDYPVERPEVVDAAEAKASFGPVLGAMMRRMGIAHCLRLHHWTPSRDIGSHVAPAPGLNRGRSPIAGDVRRPAGVLHFHEVGPRIGPTSVEIGEAVELGQRFI